MARGRQRAEARHPRLVSWRTDIGASEEGDRHPPLAAEAGSSTVFTQDDGRIRGSSPPLPPPPAPAALWVVRGHRGAAEEVHAHRSSTRRRRGRGASSAGFFFGGGGGRVDVD
jgi:hypothetical protein